MSAAQEIKARLDIVAYIQQYAPLKKGGRTYKACCPFHSERTPSFVVNPDSQTWRCFGACAEGGDIFAFAMKQHGWTFPEALNELGKLAGVEVKQQSPLERQRTERHEKLRGLLAAAAESYHKQLVGGGDDARAVLAYVHDKRGLNDQTIHDFQIGYARPGWTNMLDELTALGYDQQDIIDAGMALKNDQGRVYDRFRARLMIPIRDDRGRVVGFGARALNPDDQPKYLNSPQTEIFDKSGLLFGLDTAKRDIRDEGAAVIVEGYLDVIQAHQAGYGNVVAQMGTAMTEAQLKLLVPRYANKIILALDADAAGQNATRRSLETARQTLEADYAGRMSVDLRVLQIPGAKDPDDIIREDASRWPGIVAEAVPLADFVIGMETASLGPDATIQEREAAARRVLPLLIASESDLVRQDNVQKLAMRIRIPERDLITWAEQERRQARERAASAQRKEARSTPPSAPPGTPQAAPADDMPPPLDYDAMEPPPFVDEDRFEPDYAADDSGETNGPPDVPDSLPAVEVGPLSAPATLPRRESKADDDKLESYCLRMLLIWPETYYQINRKLRELADDDSALGAGPLSDLGVADFTRGDCRALMQMFIFAVRQDEKEVLEFLRDNLDPALVEMMGRLLLEEDTQIRAQVNGRFEGELKDVWRYYDRRVRPGLNPGGELVTKALRLRLRRVIQETNEGNFALMDAQRTGDRAAMEEISAQIHLLIQARRRLEPEIQHRPGQLV